MKTIEILVSEISNLTKATTLMEEKISELEGELSSLKGLTSENGATVKKLEKKFDREIKSEDFCMDDSRGTHYKDFKENEMQYKLEKPREEDTQMDAPPVEDMDQDFQFDGQFDLEENSNPEHKKFLKKCFQEKIGIPMNQARSINIFNFDETLIAKGFDRVVTTWQGMFWEHSREDICCRNLTRVEYPMEGVERWRANGVILFKLTKPDIRIYPRAHRLAVNPPKGFTGNCNPLTVGKWYSHVYQTKVQINKEPKTIQSRVMAKELKKICGNAYRPRRYDLEPKTKKNVVNQTGRMREVNHNHLLTFNPCHSYKLCHHI